MSDHRASSEYRSLMLNHALLKLYDASTRGPTRNAGRRRHERARRTPRRSGGRHRRPPRERDAARDGPRDVHRRPGRPDRRRADRMAGAIDERPREGHDRRLGRLSGARRRPRADRRRCPRRERRGCQERRTALSERGDVLRPCAGLGARRDSRGSTPGRSRGDGRLRTPPQRDHRDRGDRRRAPIRVPRAPSCAETPRPRWQPPRACSRA